MITGVKPDFSLLIRMVFEVDALRGEVELELATQSRAYAELGAMSL
jgi:hypothetical protein